MESSKHKQDIVWMTQDEVCASVKYGKSKVNYLISLTDPRRSSIFPKPNKKSRRNLWVKSDIDRYKEWVLAELDDSEYGNWLKSHHNDNQNSLKSSPKLELETSHPAFAHNVESIDSSIRAIGINRTEVVLKILEKAAATPQVVSYLSLLTATMLSKDIESDCQILDDILVQITRKSYLDDGVLLGILVLTRDFKPRDAIVDLMQSLSINHLNYKQFLKEQFTLLLKQYGNAKKIKKHPLWVELGESIYLMWQ